MVRVITQETYDEIVKENIEEFDMSPEEAVKEAIAQLEAQGVNLGNIIKDLALTDNNEDHLIVTSVAKLKELVDSKADWSDISVQMDIIRTECEKDLARRVRAAKEGAYPILIKLLKSDGIGANPTISILNTLIALMDTQPDLLDQEGIDVMCRLLDNSEKEIQQCTLKWISTCCLRHEKNRQAVFGSDISSKLKALLKNNKDSKVISEALLVLRRFTLDDDIRVEFSKAHEHAREMAIYLLPTLMDLLKENTKPPLVSELMLSIASVLVRHEFCQVAWDAGGVQLFDVLTDNMDNVTLSLQAVKLVTALAGNDDVKRQLVKNGIAPVIVTLLEKHINNPTFTSAVLKCIAALTLREATHARSFCENSVQDGIVQAMTSHPDHEKVQKNACWAVRNIVARSRELNAKFLELGIEPLLNTAYKKFENQFGFDIMSALRDLECEVKFEEAWKGKGKEISH